MTYRQVRPGCYIDVITKARTGLTITELLDRLRDNDEQRDFEAENGPQALGPAHDPPDHLIALDGVTELPLSPQLTEFYGYARWWRGNLSLGEIPDPGEFLDLSSDPGIGLRATIDEDLDPDAGVLIDNKGRPLDLARCALFSLDDLEGPPYGRAYLIFRAPRGRFLRPREPEIWAFDGDHKRAPDLRSWLSWHLFDEE